VVNNNYVLLTGGNGYIGSHIYVYLKQSGFEPVIVDDLSNSYLSNINQINKITGEKAIFYKCNLNNEDYLIKLIEKYDIKNIIHLAAKKSITESFITPSKYFNNNILGLISLLKSIQRNRKINFVFSSSASVYSPNVKSPIKERNILNPSSPYGHTKYLCEKILEGYSSKNFRLAILRYFNPAGAHDSGLIGQNEKNKYTNLISVIDEVAVKRRSFVPVYGKDYATIDGTCLRDYFHILDLAEGHVKALLYLINNKNGFTVNLGSGIGATTLEIIKKYRKVNKVDIPYKFYKRREGDVDQLYTSNVEAKKILGWESKRSLDKICSSSYKWTKSNKLNSSK